MSIYFRPPDGIMGGRHKPLTAQDILPGSATVQELIAVKSMLNELTSVHKPASEDLKALLRAAARTT